MARPSTFRPTPALGVTYLLDTEEEDVKRITPLLPVTDDTTDKNYDPRADQDSIDIDGDESEESFPYPTPSSVVSGKRKATEIYDVDEEGPRQSERLRGKKARSGRGKKEPEYICISSDSDDDIAQTPKPAEKKHVDRTPPRKQPIAPSRPKSEEEEGPRKEASGNVNPGYLTAHCVMERRLSSASPEAETGSVERLRPDTPNSLATQLAKVEKANPASKLDICYHYSISDGDVWSIKCLTCTTNTEKKVLSVGPGSSLGYLNLHIKGKHHLSMLGKGAGPSNDAQGVKLPQPRDPSPPPAPKRVAAARPATVKRRQRAADQGHGDDVERFLDQMGLPVDLAPKLRSFGFESDERMNQIGRLTDESLGLLLEDLKKEGVDVVTAIMVREGLKRRAGTL
ncbi:hypothetical protein LXA43DRAFT_972771 [Ganoderma leucocontextum]|nr:hypothetical protein LXA43DRAFT_972771 [Ganoderma leucocontextum]